MADGGNLGEEFHVVVWHIDRKITTGKGHTADDKSNVTTKKESETDRCASLLIHVLERCDTGAASSRFKYRHLPLFHLVACSVRYPRTSCLVIFKFKPSR